MTRRTFLLSSGVAAYQVRALEWLALDNSGQIEHRKWTTAGSAVSVGSLLKPFLAVTYLTVHEQAPVVECLGAAAGCWQSHGHGRQDLVSAIANSCNAYFLQLAQDLNRAALDLTCLSYGLAAPPRSWPVARLIGLGQGWPQAPLSVARAYAALARNRTDLHVRAVLVGMARCATSGTARAAGISCYAKTGTALCSHIGGGSGDGYVMAIYPAEQPRHVILLRRHNTTGATAAADLKPLITSLS